MRRDDLTASRERHEARIRDHGEEPRLPSSIHDFPPRRFRWRHLSHQGGENARPGHQPGATAFPG
jgi:hypothetical protein